jgi:hypothetical protein
MHSLATAAARRETLARDVTAAIKRLAGQGDAQWPEFSARVSTLLAGLSQRDLRELHGLLAGAALSLEPRPTGRP